MAIGGIALITLLFVVLTLVGLGVGLFALVNSGRVEHSEIILIAGLGAIALLALACVVAGALFFVGMPVMPGTSSSAPPPVMVMPTTPPLEFTPETSAQVVLVPSEPTIEIGEGVSITIYATGVGGLYGVEVHLTHDEEGLEARGIVPGTCARGSIQSLDAGAGAITYVATRSETEPPFSGDCDVAAFTIVGQKSGIYPITFDAIVLTNAQGDALPVEATGGTVTVEASSP